MPVNCLCDMVVCTTYKNNCQRRSSLSEKWTPQRLPPLSVQRSTQDQLSCSERPFHKSIFARLDHIKMCVLVYWLLALQKDLCYVRALYYYYHRLPKVFTSTFCNSPPNRWSQLTCAWPSSMAERRPGLVSSTSRNGWPSLWLKQYWKTSNTQNTGVTTATVSFVHSVPLHLVITQLYKKI